MKKHILILIIIAFFQINIFSIKEKIITNNNQYNGKTKEQIFEKDDKLYKQMDKRLNFFDNEEKIIKTELYFNKKFSEESGFIKQIKYFSFIIDKGYHLDKLETFYSEEEIKKKGINKNICYIEKNYATKIEYYNNDNLIHTDENGMLSDESDYPILLLYYCDNLIQKSYKDSKIEEGAVHFLIDFQCTKGRSLVLFLNEIKEIDDIDKQFIDWYFASLDLDKNNKDLYKKKILVQENDKKYWVLFQEKQFKYLKKDSKILIYYYIGGYNDKIIFLGSTFCEK